MAKIQQCAIALFGFIARHDICLETATEQDGLCDCLWLACQQGRRVLFKPGKKGFIEDGAVLHDFCKAGGQFSARQGIQGGDIGDDGARLMKRTHQILALRQIDSGLSAD